MAVEKPEIHAIFNAAIAQPSEEDRVRYLDQVCCDDLQARARVEALLRAHSEAGGFFGGKSPAFVATIAQPAIVAAPGTQIGPYKLLQQIGEGGMGTVYMAEQTEPVQRKVALKLIKPGMDSRQVIARFEAERQALALMDHPHIAKVLDAGTTDSGLPYFVMELVKGVPITKYCDEHHLTPRQRLELFIPVCQAVQHAHQKGIIHRDLKPSNVLVALYDGRPVPKVIDFGVAKATGQKLTERTMYTEFGAIVGTLEYMSPEQAESNQLDIDTRSDIYSLGVLLYELLTGTTPFEKKRLKDAALLEVLRIIREDEPQKPSTRLSTTDELPSISANRGLEPNKLSALVRGELDWIVMKALEKDRNRRYETPNGFAVDIQRYLADEPVSACPPSAAYRLRKFARRNKAGLVTASLVAGALLAGTTVSTWQAIRATNALESERRTRAALDQERNQVNGKIGEKLLEVAALRERARAAGLTDGTLWADLLDTARRAETLTSSELADPALVERVRGLLEQVRKDDKNRQMALRLRELRFDNLAILPGTPIPRDVAKAVADAFREHGLPVTDVPVAEAAGRVRASSLREELLTGLDVWSIWDVQRGGTEWKRLLAVAQAADDHPWRRECRDAALMGDFATLTQLGRREESPRQPAEAVLLLATFLVGRPRPGGWAVTDEELSVANELLEKARVWHSEDTRIGLALAAWFPGASREVDNVATTRETIARLKQEGASPEALAAAYFRLGQLLAMKNDDKAGVVAACREAIHRMPDRAEYRTLLIDKLQNLDEIIAECTDWIQSGPVRARPYYERGRGYWNRGKMPEALSDFTKLTEISPQDAVAWGWRGAVHRELRQFNESLEAFTTAIEVATRAGQNPAYYWNGRGVTYHNMPQEFDNAIADFTRAIELDPKNGEYWAFRAETYRYKGDLQKAMEDYDILVAIPSYHRVRGLTGRAILNKQLGRWEAEIRDYTEVLKSEPKNGYATSHLFWVLIDCPDPALRDPRRALALDNECGPLFNDRPDFRRRLLEKAKELIDAEEEP
jgi:serine/threonine protein kinase/tetratricopeptide (TPR) repeat protein